MSGKYKNLVLYKVIRDDQRSSYHHDIKVVMKLMFQVLALNEHL